MSWDMVTLCLGIRRSALIGSQSEGCIRRRWVDNTLKSHCVSKDLMQLRLVTTHVLRASCVAGLVATLPAGSYATSRGIATQVR